MKLNVQDVTASAVAIILAAGAVLLAALEIPIPGELTTAMGAAFTWLFVRAGYAMTKPSPRDNEQ